MVQAEVCLVAFYYLVVLETSLKSSAVGIEMGITHGMSFA